MRFFKTFLLRLYVDQDTPDRLCGKLRPLETMESYRFKDEGNLVDLLRKLSIPVEDQNQVKSVKSFPNREEK